MAKGILPTRGSNWSTFLDRKAAATPASPAPTPDVYEAADGYDRLNKIFENTLRADLQGDNRRCKRNTDYGPCGHAPKLKGDLYCEFHKEAGKFAATRFIVETFANHPRVQVEIQANLPAAKPSV